MHRTTLLFITAVTLALCCHAARAERDVDYVRLLREQGFWDIALDEIARLESLKTTPEDTRALLLIEKARVYRDTATYTIKPGKQIENIEKSRAVLDAYLEKYPNRPEKLEVEFEKLLLAKMLGKAYATSAGYESGEHEQKVLFDKALAAFQSARAGYLKLSDSFVKQSSALATRIEALQQRKLDAKPAEMAKLLNEIEVLVRDKERADEYAMQCEFLAAGCILEQARAFIGPEAKPDKAAQEVIARAVAAYEAFFKKYRDTVYLPTAYEGLFGIIDCLRLTGRADEALNRLIGETTAFLIQHRDDIDNPTLKATLGKLRLERAKILNDLHRPDEAAQALHEALLGPGGDDYAMLEQYRALLVQGNVVQGLRGLIRLASEPGAAHLDAKTMLAEWFRTNTDSPAISRIPVEMRYEAAVNVFYKKLYPDAARMFLSIVRDDNIADEDAFKPRSLLMAAICTVSEGQRRSDALAAEGKRQQADEALRTALESGVEMLFGQLVPKYGASEDGDVVRVVQQALALSVKWQGTIVGIDNSEKNVSAMKTILQDFNRRFPDMRGLPDADYIEGLTLEQKKAYAEAIAKYAKTNPNKNQWYLAKIREGVCRYKMLPDGNKDVEAAESAWKALTEGGRDVEAKLAEVGENELEKYERPDFIYAVGEATYYRAALIYTAGPEILAKILPQGSDKYRFVTAILQDFATKYPNSDFKATAAFLQAASYIKLGKAQQAEKSLPLLRDNPERYAAILRELRELYYLRYIEALQKSDKTAADEAGARYIALAMEYYENYSDKTGLNEATQMANYYFETDQFDKALPLLRDSAIGLQKRADEFRSTGAHRQELETTQALLIVKDRLASCLFEVRPAEASTVYDELAELRRQLLKAEKPDITAYRTAVREDFRLMRYTLRKAMCDIIIESAKSGSETDLDKLAAAVNTLAENIQVIETRTPLWWEGNYWLAYGLYLQGNLQTAHTVLLNIKNATSDFSDESGGGGIGYKGETFKTMFEKLMDMTDTER